MEDEDPFILKDEPPAQKEEDPFALPKEPPPHKAASAPHSDVIPTDVSFKDVLMPQVQSIQQRISDAVRSKLEAVVVNAVPQFPKVSLILGLIAVGAGVAIPLGLYGMVTTMLVVIPLAIVGGILGYGMRSDKLSRIGLGLAAVALVESVACPLYFKNQKQAYDERVAKEEHERQEKRGDELAAEEKRKTEAETKRVADEQARRKAEEEARKAEDDRRNAEWRKQQEEAVAKKAAEDAKKAEDARLAKLKADEEIRKKKAEEAAREAAGVKKAADVEAAKAVYHDISVKVDDLTLALTKLETSLKVAKEEMEKKAIFLERRNSPVPPSDDELARAQKSYDQWKTEVDRLKGLIPGAKVDLDAASKEKQKAADTLDALQK